MTVSLLISTYNWPQALGLCLESVMRQTLLPTEILIADDGSGDETRKLIAAAAATSPVPVRHIWQEDRGFRVGMIRNKAIAASSCDYIVQIDGDMLLDRNFIRDHAAFARRGTFVSGSRGYMNEALSARILAGEARPSPFARGMGSRNNALRLPVASRLYRLLGLHRRVRGCNIAFWRDDALRINGYDECFNGWGWEDTDLAVRLGNSGIRQQCIRFGGIGYHLFHPKSERPNLAENERACRRSEQTGAVRCEKGIDQYQ